MEDTIDCRSSTNTQAFAFPRPFPNETHVISFFCFLNFFSFLIFCFNDFQKFLLEISKIYPKNKFSNFFLQIFRLSNLQNKLKKVQNFSSKISFSSPSKRVRPKAPMLAQSRDWNLPEGWKNHERESSTPHHIPFESVFACHKMLEFMCLCLAHELPLCVCTVYAWIMATCI
jgi:hypothetical protein